MADHRVFSAAEWQFLKSHPDIIFEGVNPVYYRQYDSVTSIIGIDRYDVFASLALK